jgi:hypothetical protein
MWENDSLSHEEGTKEVYVEVKAAYTAMGASEKVGLFGSPLQHAYKFFDRRETYRWFNRWLARNGGRRRRGLMSLHPML